MKKKLITPFYILTIIASVLAILRCFILLTVGWYKTIDLSITVEIVIYLAILIFSIVQLVRFKKNDNANQYRSFGVISILVSFCGFLLLFLSFEGVFSIEFAYKYFLLFITVVGLVLGILAVTNSEKLKVYGAFVGTASNVTYFVLSISSLIPCIVFGNGPEYVYFNTGILVYSGGDMLLFGAVKILLIVANILYAVAVYPVYKKLFPRKNRLFGNRNSGSSHNKSTENKSSNIPSSKEEAMEKYGMTEEEAELLFPTENKVEVPTAQERSEQLMKEAANRQNSSPSGSGVGLGMGYGLGLNVSQTQQSPSQSAKNADPNAVAELKREYLQGKITKEEFNARLAELRK